MPSTFTIRLTRAHWLNTTTVVEKVTGFAPVYPKVGEKMAIDEIFMLVRNGNTVVMKPPIREEI